MTARLPVLGATVALMLAGCGGGEATTPNAPLPPPPAPASATVSRSPAEVLGLVRQLYDGYRANLDQAAARRFLAPTFAQAAFNSGLDHDALLCAQNVPQSINYLTPRFSASHATVPVTTHFEKSPAQLLEVNVELNSMLVDSVLCPA